MGYNWSVTENILDYEEAQKIVQKLGIKTGRECIKMKKENNEFLKNLPRNPYATYKYRNSWKGWHDFLGDDGCDWRRVGWVQYEEAKKIVQNLGIKTEREYRKMKKENNEFIKNIPRTPHVVYKRQNLWKGWADFLKNKPDWIKYEEAKKIVQKLGIRNKKEFIKMKKENKLLEAIPSNPQIFYGKGKK